MAFKEALEKAASEVDALLNTLMPVETAAAPNVIEAMRYASLGQGKRVRPFFVTESAKLFGVERAHALRAGAAVECIHCYSLVHDDLPAMDDDDLRRGKPTTHIAFDEATAILAGDGLLTFAFEILSDPATHSDANVRIQLVSELARASGIAGMVGGQMLDLQAEAEESHDLEQIITLQGMKTGALFHYSLLAGATLAQAGDDARASLATYAEKIGLAFQVADDVLDHESTPEELGKQTQKDAEAGKATFIDLYGLEGAKAKAQALVNEGCAPLDMFGDDADILRQAARFIIERKN
ncbi:MAG: polyprenyl synthetase family protein [Hyphomicrobiales bacterium]